MMVFMVRGLLTSLQFPHAQFACADIAGDMLYDPFWEAVHRIETCGLKVLSATFDGCSVNRRLIKVHNPKDGVLHKVVNPFAQDRRSLYFFADPPYLIKTVRNCRNSKCRSMWKNGKSISWSHLVALYHRDTKSASGIRIVPKLKLEHISLMSFSKMRVDLAAQVS